MKEILRVSQQAAGSLGWQTGVELRRPRGRVGGRGGGVVRGVVLGVVLAQVVGRLGLAASNEGLARLCLLLRLLRTLRYMSYRVARPDRKALNNVI